MEIKRIDRKVEDILRGAEYLGCGASKEAFEKDDIIYKVPRGRVILERSEILERLNFPSTIDEVDNFLMNVENWEEQMVWPLGQFAIELIVWNSLLELEKEGLSIDRFARIKDCYITLDNVIVIEQEKANYFDHTFEDDFDNLWDEVKLLNTIMKERFSIDLRDIRDGNCGFSKNGKLKLFDFGISTTTDLDSYGSYSDYNDDDYDDEGSW